MASEPDPELAAAVEERSGGRIELVASALSADGRLAAALLREPEPNFWLEAVYEHQAAGWKELATSDGDLAWSPLGDRDGTTIGALRFYGQAPPEAVVVLVVWLGETHEVPVQNGHFAFASWDAAETDVMRGPPEVAGFRRADGSELAVP